MGDHTAKQLDGSAPEEFLRLAEELGLPLDDEELESIVEAGREILTDYERLDQLAEPRRQASPRVRGFRPTAEQDPHHSFVWRVEVRERETGLLAGRTVGLKDNISLAGSPMLVGSPFFEGFEPDQDATVVERLLDAGATIVGKTAVPAFCFEGAGIFGYPEPVAVNPVRPSHLPGGSSSGSAVAVVSGQADIAIGADQAGSIRIPSSWCGAVGLKPTFGLVPYTGVVAVELTLDTVGPIARTVEDCALTMAAIAGPDPEDPRQTQALQPADYPAALQLPAGDLRVATLSEGFAHPGLSDPRVDELVKKVTEAAFGEVGEASAPGHRDGLALWNAICLQGATDVLVADGNGTNWRGRHDTALARFIREHWAERAADLPPTLKLNLVLGRFVSARTGYRYYAKAQNLARGLAVEYDQALEGYDALVMPTTPTTAPPIPSAPTPAERLRTAVGLETSINLAAFNVSGHPAVSVPCGDIDGLPAGLMVVARRGRDDVALRVAAEIEKQVARGVEQGAK